MRIEPIGDGPYFGFEIDGDHLFLLGDFTVTHNTYLGLWFCHEALKRKKRAMFMCDRITLIDQTSTTADRYGLSAHGIIQANHWRHQPDLPFQIASAQTLARRQFPEPLDLLIVDECHSQLQAWLDFIDKDTPTRVIGLSATPFSKGLGKRFTNLVNAATMHQLTEAGVLVPMRVYSCTPADMKGAEISGGEWTDKAAEERGLKIVGDVVSEWFMYGEGRKTICFGATIKHCEEIVRQFNESGVMAATFTKDTSKAEREKLLSEYRKPDSLLRVLVSVEALAKGFDVPDVGCVIDCRPLRKSLSTFIQMIGRGARSSPETGKTDFILLDHSNNICRFLDDFTDVFYNGLHALDSGEKLDSSVRKDEEQQDVKACPKCGYKPFRKRCIACGHEHVAPALVEHVPGMMREITIGKKVAAANAADLWAQVVTYSKAHGKPETAYGRACHTYREIFGDFPPKHWKLDVPNVPVSQPVLNKIRSRYIAFARSRRGQ